MTLYIVRTDRFSFISKEWSLKKVKIENAGFVFATIVNLTTWFLIGDEAIVLGAMGVGQVWVIIAFSTRYSIREEYQKPWMWSGVAVVFACALFGLGVAESHATLKTTLKDEIVLKKSETSETVRGVVVRRFEQAIIIKTEANVIVVLQPPDLLRVTISGGQRRNHGMLCKYFDLACPSVLPGKLKEEKKPVPIVESKHS